MEDEETLERLLKDYEAQLTQMKTVLEVSEGNTKDEIIMLCDDLAQLIELTKDSLLGLKKARLLKEIESLEQNSDTKDSARQSYPSECHGEVDPMSSSSTEKGNQNSDFENLLTSLEGTKCQAPFGQSWGQLAYHNALVLSVESDQEPTSVDDIQVRVVFCYPTINKMKPCSFYLEGNCKFSDADCRYSHGHLVNFQSLRPFSDPNYSLLQRDAKCLAKFTDGLWYPAVVESVNDESHKVTVKYKEDDSIKTLELADVLPDNVQDTDSDSSDDVSLPDDENEDDEDEVENFCPAAVWVSTVPSSQALGEWEKYTKGIGSKLMMKMGYVLGNGLGKNGEGRTEPVEAVVIPKGKSLDAVMKLKEKTDSHNLIKVEKKLRRKLKNKEKTVSAGYQYTPKSTVFDFINKKLGNDENMKDTSNSHHKNKKLSDTQQMLKSTPTKSLNAKSFQVAEDIRKSQLDLDRLKTALLRNEMKDKLVSAQLKEKISQHQNSISQLQALEKAIHGEQHLRKSERKLTVF